MSIEETMRVKLEEVELLGAQFMDGEKVAILQVITLADQYGYGNFIAWLGTAWAIKLMANGLNQSEAIAAVECRGPYKILIS